MLKSFTIRPYLLYILVFVIALTLFGWLQASPTVADSDAFYHAKMAVLMKEKVIIQDFPWLQATVLKDYYIDHHLLYHLLLVPLVNWFNPLVAVKLLTVILAALAIFFLFWLLRKLKVKFAFIFALLPLLAWPFLVRISLVKANGLSLIILFLGIYFIFTPLEKTGNKIGEGDKKTVNSNIKSSVKKNSLTGFKHKYWGLAILSFFYVWSYGGWPIILLVVLIYCLANSIQNMSLRGDQRPTKQFLYSSGIALSRLEVGTGNDSKADTFCILHFFRSFLKKDNRKLLTACVAGLIAGLIINPYFPKNLVFYWYQFVEIGIKNYSSQISVGAEWYPYDILLLVSKSIFVFIAWLTSLAWILTTFTGPTRKITGRTRIESQALTLAIFSFLFFILTVKSRRYCEYFIPLACLSSGLTFNSLFSTLNWKNYWQKFKSFFDFPYSVVSFLLLFYLGVGFITLGIYTVKSSIIGTKEVLDKGENFHSYQAASEFLKKNTPQGSTIFHSDWDIFPMLFYHNHYNHYLVGLDATFMYRKSPDLYWKWYHITTGDTKKPLSKIIKEEFNASYILTKKGRVDFIHNLERDEDIEKIFEDSQAKIYRIK